MHSSDSEGRKSFALSIRFTWLALGLFILFALVCQSARAQSAAVSGLVIDPSGASVQNVQITLTNERTGVVLHSKTNNVGMYSLPFVPPGKYTLTAEAAGFKRVEEKAIAVETAQNLALDVKLQVGSNAESVTVDGSVNHLNTTDGTVSTLVDRQFAENIPMNGRSFQSLMTAVPGVVSAVGSQGAQGDMVVNGQRPEANYYTVDGVSATTGVGTGGHDIGWSAGYAGTVSNTTALGTTQSMVSVDDLQEFRALTSSYSAEYGRTPGGQFSMSTRSGSNAWHGLGFEYLRNGDFDANNWFNKYQAPVIAREAERQSDFGGTFSGPLTLPKLYNGKDKTFFFFSYEGLRLQVPYAATTSVVPSSTMRSTANSQLLFAINSYPVANGADLGDGLAYYKNGYSAPSNVDSTSIRVDHNFGDKWKLFGRYSDVDSKVTTRATNLAEEEFTSANTKSVTVGSTNTITHRLVNDLRFNYTTTANNNSSLMTDFGGAVAPDLNSSVPSYNTAAGVAYCLCWDLDDSTFIGGQKPTTQQQINIVDWAGFTTGHHIIKFGVDYRRLHTQQWYVTPYSYGWFYSLASIQTDTVGFGLVKDHSAHPDINPVYTNFSAYVQDEWKASQRLNLSMGIRWDVNPAPKDADGFNPYTLNETSDLATAVLAPKGAALYNTKYTNFAPRVGMAYQIRQTPGKELVLRSAFGMFYDLGTQQASYGYDGVGTTTLGHFNGSAFPYTTAQLQAIPTPSTAAPYSAAVIAYDPNFKAPVTLQWNVSLEQSLGSNQTITLAYVGSNGRDLVYQRVYYPGLMGNTNFTSSDGVYINENGANSTYNALQATYRRNLSAGLQLLASYTWAHNIDNDSTNFEAFELEKASSDNDVRQSFQTVISYNVPNSYKSALANNVLGHWGFDAKIAASSAPPVDIIGESTTDSAGVAINYHPDWVANQPLYVSGGPGGRTINYNAFSIATDGSGNYVEGNVPRNAARGFDAVQVDSALRREFAIAERLSLQFRAEVFNLFNHAQFGDIYNQLSSGSTLFGTAAETRNNVLASVSPLYQTGGPRSLQLALRLQF